MFDRCLRSRRDATLPGSFAAWTAPAIRHRPYDAARDVDALLILTGWHEFANLDFTRVQRAMRYPLVVDGRNLLSPETMRAYGFAYISIGRAPVDPRPAGDLALPGGDPVGRALDGHDLTDSVELQ
jgi:hypothetical protein